MYTYEADVVHIVDGDTMHLDVDLGCDTHIRLTVRLAGINAPEINTPEGRAAEDYVYEWLEGHAPIGRVVLRTVKDRKEKYGRYLGYVYADDAAVLNDDLVVSGHAVPYDGGKR